MNDRDAYEKKLQAQLDEWKAQIVLLEAKAQAAGAEAQLEYGEQVEKLRSMRDSAEEQLVALRSASDSAWEDMKKGADAAWDSLSDAMKSASDRFKSG